MMMMMMAVCEEAFNTQIEERARPSVLEYPAMFDRLFGEWRVHIYASYIRSYIKINVCFRGISEFVDFQ